MLVRVPTAALSGITGRYVTVECDVRRGLPAFSIVGMTDHSIREARERVRLAILAAGFEFPAARIVVNVAPSSVRKTGAGFDTAIALAVLAASGQIDADAVADVAPLAELALGGELRPVRGTLPLAEAVIEHGITAIAVPPDAHGDAAIAQPVRLLIAGSLRELVDALDQPPAMHAPPPPRIVPPSADAYRPDVADLRVRPDVIRAMTIAAVGGHGLLFVGPPAAGSLMLARRLPGLLPDLTWEQAVDVARIHSAAGLRDAQDAGVATARPFRAPHHTIGPSGLVGGGGGLWPGEVSLAHLGVLALQDVDEFHRASLEALRAPATTGSVTIQRGQHATTFPARCQLVATATLRAGADSDRLRQLRRINQIRDFFDLVVPVARAASGVAGDPVTTSAAVREQVLDARAVLASSPAPPPLSDRISRVALAIAALDGSAVPRSDHVDEAAQLTDAVAIAAA